MKTLRSFVKDRWHTADAEFVSLLDPCSEETIARVSSHGLDFAAALEFARLRGGPALRELTFAERGELLASMSKVLHAHRDELIDLSLEATGTTRRDAKFDLDGATFTLSHYADLGREMGGQRLLVDAPGVQLGRSARFWGEHIGVPLGGVAVHINAFNFPAWGLAEKAACALLAGMPVISKPATSTAQVTERCVEILVDAQILPPGTLSLICGRTGDLLDRLGSQDVLAFTGSASTALELRGKRNLLASSCRVNIEADSLNAAVLGPDVGGDGETWEVFLRDVVREVTQKTGQKCTAVRRVVVPAERLDAVQESLVERLGRTVVGNPREASVTMGPLASGEQLRAAVEGVGLLRGEAEMVAGTGERVDGLANPAGKGFFFGPTLLRAAGGGSGSAVHEHEVFGPVATLVPYDDSPRGAADIVALGGGSLVTSVYSDDTAFLGGYLNSGGCVTGRLYMATEKVSAMLPGSGLVLPSMLHGGPGRAGGGAELGGLRGLWLYTQKVALGGDRGVIRRLTGGGEA